ncbi:MAG TPA: L,D-transpeptidase/peptidoglycan binding protein, partial [Actinomycetota bacterium]|nr:L,D-transpeptidase/peptidoglycan binding protein [Actinomycetota bacterium]
AVGGLTADQAVAKVLAEIAPDLNRELKLRWAGRRWTVTPEELGVKTNAQDLVAEALQASADTSFLQRVRMSLFKKPLDFAGTVEYRYPRGELRGFVRGVAAGLDRAARDARIDYSTGWVDIKEARPGRRLIEGKSRRALLDALEDGESTVNLTVKTVKPEVTEEAFDKVLLLHIGANKLYLYEDGKIVHSWPVATGQPEYPTPTGLYEITEKRYMPTWVNPDPDGWGASMPASIPPGPGNPLGTRALNWSAPAIRFHGTSADYSIGYNASHGCVRMHMWDVEQLYDLVDVGTPIVSLNFGGLKPLYASAPDPTPVAEDEVEAPQEPDEPGKRKGN